MPNVSESVSFTSAIVTSIITCRDGTSSLRSACSMIEYSDGVATIRIVFWSLSATTWMLRTTPPSPPSAPVIARRAAPDATTLPAPPAVDDVVDVVLCVVVFDENDDCGWNVGGEMIEPAGVPGATVGGGAACGCVTWPVNACCSSGPMCSARWFCRLYT